MKVHPSTVEYSIDWIEHNIPSRIPAGSWRTLWLRLRNTGAFVWRCSSEDGERTDLVIRFNQDIHCMAKVEGPVNTGAEAILHVPIRFPAGTGKCIVRLELVRQNVAWFRDHGSPPLEVVVEITASEESASGRMWRSGWTANKCNYQPGNGAWWCASGNHYPQFVSEAKGCFFWDADGRQFIDYVMGWGAVLLGHAHPRLCRAVERSLSRGNLTSLPHVQEFELTRLLCERIPSAEAVLFAKNGSDATTVAVRLAKVFTGRSHVVFSGYHGWQDWNNDSIGAGSDGISTHKSSHRLLGQDIDSLYRLFREHPNQIAAVVVEPAAQIEGVDGPVQDANSDFLFEAAELARRSGAMVVFDEIFTGFRYPGGSVQQALDLVPDLTCLGKALSSGAALSAVVGRRDIFERAAHAIQYHPTFKGEASAMASALEALKIYGEQNVPNALWRFGERLAAGINASARAAGVRGSIVGLPCRMVFRFDEAEPTRRICLRTFLEQQLLNRGIFAFRGFLLPSVAHDENVLQETLDAFHCAFTAVAEAVSSGDLISRLELPPIV